MGDERFAKKRMSFCEYSSSQSLRIVRSSLELYEALNKKITLKSPVSWPPSKSSPSLEQQKHAANGVKEFQAIHHSSQPCMHLVPSATKDRDRRRRTTAVRRRAYAARCLPRRRSPVFRSTLASCTKSRARQLLKASKAVGCAVQTFLKILFFSLRF